MISTPNGDVGFRINIDEKYSHHLDQLEQDKQKQIEQWKVLEAEAGVDLDFTEEEWQELTTEQFDDRFNEKRIPVPVEWTRTRLWRPVLELSEEMGWVEAIYARNGKWNWIVSYSDFYDVFETCRKNLLLHFEKQAGLASFFMNNFIFHGNQTAASTIRKQMMKNEDIDIRQRISEVVQSLLDQFPPK